MRATVGAGTHGGAAAVGAVELTALVLVPCHTSCDGYACFWVGPIPRPTAAAIKLGETGSGSAGLLQGPNHSPVTSGVAVH